MLRAATQFLHRHATARGITTSLVASALVGILPLWYAIVRIRAGSPGAVPLDTTSGYTPDAAYAMIATYTADARSYYVFNAFTADVLAPALFLVSTSLLSTVSLRRLTPPTSRWRSLVPLLALAAWLADLAENALLSRIVLNYPERLDATAELANAATLIKRTLVFSNFGLVVASALILAGSVLLGRRSPRPA